MIELKGGGYDGCQLRRTIGKNIDELQAGDAIKIVGSNRRIGLNSNYEVRKDGTARVTRRIAQFIIHEAEVDL